MPSHPRNISWKECTRSVAQRFQNVSSRSPLLMRRGFPTNFIPDRPRLCLGRRFETSSAKLQERCGLFVNILRTFSEWSSSHCRRSSHASWSTAAGSDPTPKIWRQSVARLARPCFGQTDGSRPEMAAKTPLLAVAGEFQHFSYESLQQGVSTSVGVTNEGSWRGLATCFMVSYQKEAGRGPRLCQVSSVRVSQLYSRVGLPPAMLF